MEKPVLAKGRVDTSAPEGLRALYRLLLLPGQASEPEPRAPERPKEVHDVELPGLPFRALGPTGDICHPPTLKHTGC